MAESGSGERGEDEGSSASGWRPCSACKKPIAFGAHYYTCSVSTCNRKRTALYFCDVSCWEVHLPIARHREAWAEEQTAPSQAQASASAEAAIKVASSGSPAASKPTANPAATRDKRRIIATPTSKPAAARDASDPKSPAAADKTVLIVASKLKDYIRQSSGMNTSERVLGPLSDIVRDACEDAIRVAEADGRKTVLDRDFKTRR